MAAHSYREIINERPDFHFSRYPRDEWRADAARGMTELGYGEIVAGILESEMRHIPLPKDLQRFVPKTRRTDRTQRLWLQRFIDDGYVIYHLDYSRVYSILSYAFSRLIPFSVLEKRSENLIAVTEDARGLDASPAFDTWDTLYTWDCQEVPDFSELQCRSSL